MEHTTDTDPCRENDRQPLLTEEADKHPSGASSVDMEFMVEEIEAVIPD